MRSTFPASSSSSAGRTYFLSPQMSRFLQSASRPAPKRSAKGAQDRNEHVGQLPPRVTAELDACAAHPLALDRVAVAAERQREWGACVSPSAW
jgi:hypothetical protein